VGHGKLNPGASGDGGAEQLVRVATELCEALELSPFAHAVLDLEARVVAVNATLLRWTGRNGSWAFTGVSFATAAMDPVSEAFDRARRGESASVEVEGVAAFPELAGFFSLQFTPLRQQGRIVGVAVACEDLRARASSLDPDRVLTAVLDHLPDGVLLERAGLLVYANRVALDELGYASAAQLVGASVYEVVGPSVLAALRANAGASAARTTERRSVPLLHRSGRASSYDVRALRLPEHEGASTLLVLSPHHSAHSKATGSAPDVDGRMGSAFAVSEDFRIPVAGRYPEQRGAAPKRDVPSGWWISPRRAATRGADTSAVGGVGVQGLLETVRSEIAMVQDLLPADSELREPLDAAARAASELGERLGHASRSPHTSTDESNSGGRAAGVEHAAPSNAGTAVGGTGDPGARASRADETPVRSGRTNAVSQAARASGRVLVCDDETRLAMLTAGLLEQYGFSVGTVGTGEDAVQALAADPRAYDALLLDLNLPDQGAADVIRALRVRGLTHPVVLTSGYAEEDVPTELRRDPQVVGYLGKPYPLELLVQMMRKATGSDDAPSGRAASAFGRR
jgi:CheY-like chemotaxis protein/PAS domain-containing protein